MANMTEGDSQFNDRETVAYVPTEPSPDPNKRIEIPQSVQN